MPVFQVLPSTFRKGRMWTNKTPRTDVRGVSGSGSEGFTHVQHCLSFVHLRWPSIYGLSDEKSPGSKEKAHDAPFAMGLISIDRRSLVP